MSQSEAMENTKSKGVITVVTICRHYQRACYLKTGVTGLGGMLSVHVAYHDSSKLGLNALSSS